MSRGVQFQREGVYLHIGCGLIAPEGWINCDASWNARLAKVPGLRLLLANVGLISRGAAEVPWPRNIQVWDVRRGLPHKDNSVSGIYTSHFLEHLSGKEAPAFLRESHRALVPGGVIRLVVPGLEVMGRRYCEREAQAPPGDPAPAKEFLESLGVFRSDQRAKAPWPLRIYRRLNPLDLHQWLYDETSLRKCLRDVGFTDICRRGYLESRLPHVAEVEREERFNDALCLEAVKT